MAHFIAQFQAKLTALAGGSGRDWHILQRNYPPDCTQTRSLYLNGSLQRPDKI